ncbi:MAG: hypothetical protein JNM27_03465 [Leptospirales bacterium]|nr:hypothetical protein [Leptospirales bacterium]
MIKYRFLNLGFMVMLLPFALFAENFTAITVRRVATTDGRTFSLATLTASNPFEAQGYRFTPSATGMCANVPQLTFLIVRHLSSVSGSQLCWGAKPLTTPQRDATCGEDTSSGILIPSITVTCSAAAMALCRKYSGIEEIWLKDGSALLGRVIAQKGAALILQTAEGMITVPLHAVDLQVAPMDCP